MKTSLLSDLVSGLLKNKDQETMPAERSNKKGDGRKIEYKHKCHETELKELDLLLIQQCMARRFISLFPDDYHRIVAIRDAIHESVQANGMCYGSRGKTTYPKASETASIMTLLDSEEGLLAVKNLDTKKALLLQSVKRNNFWMKNKDSLACILEEMSKHTEELDLLKRKYNFFDYFSTAFIAGLCNAESLYRSYSKTNRQKNYPKDRKIETGASNNTAAKQESDAIRDKTNLDFAKSSASSPLRLIHPRIRVHHITTTVNQEELDAKIAALPQSKKAENLANYADAQHIFSLIKELKKLPSPRRSIRLEVDLDSIPLDVERGIAYFENCLLDELQSELRTTSEIKERINLQKSLQNGSRQKGAFINPATNYQTAHAA